jgi:hypothetical protein
LKSGVGTWLRKLTGRTPGKPSKVKGRGSKKAVAAAVPPGMRSRAYEDP